MNTSASVIPSVASFQKKLQQMPQRAERRVSHRVPCRVRTIDAGPETAISAVGQTVNLSVNGVAVQLGHPIDAGTPVEVFLPHLDGVPMLLQGHVAHSRRVLSGTFEIGIRINQPESENAAD